MTTFRTLSRLTLGVLLSLGALWSSSYAVELNSTNITSAPFNCSIGATSCNLSSKNITSIASGTFVNHTSLQELYLYSNLITSIESGDFAGLSSLRSLELNGNQIMSIESGDFAGFISVTYLNLNGNQITSIENGSFVGLSSLTQLHLQGNQIISIENGSFAGLSSLTQLYLQGNQIISIENGSFAGLSSLTQLYLQGNQIISIENGSFVGLSSLTTLSLYSNQITSIENGSFAGLSSLTTLSLYSNQITSIESGDFAGLSSLTNLGLDSNQITSIESGDFAGLSSLTNLRLNRNQITSIESGDFAGLSSLTTLELGVQQITSIENGAFAGLSSLTTLGLGWNLITSIESDDFAGLSSLTNLYLINNQFSSLPENIFANNPNLNVLNLANNQFSSLPENIFANNPNLSSLSLYNNQLSSLPETIFASNSNLQTLDLTNNKLSNLPSSLLGLPLTSLYSANNCLLPTTLSTGVSSYLDTYADDNPNWSLSQYGCVIDFGISMWFQQNPYQGIANVLQISPNQGIPYPSVGNFIELYGVDDMMTISLMDNPSWTVSGGVYRYNLPDLTGTLSKNIFLTGTLKTIFPSGSIILTGIVGSTTYEYTTGDNISQYMPYIYPTTDYVLSGTLGAIGQYGDIKTISLNYDIASSGGIGSDGIVVAHLGSGMSLLSSGWSSAYASGGLFMTGDICYDVLIDEIGPYYKTIEQTILSWGFTSVDEWLVNNYGYASDPTQVMERFSDFCLIQGGYSSLASCLNAEFGIQFSKAKYPQCGGPKSFVNTNDVCYNQFFDEQGQYYTALEQTILSWGSYSSLDEWLVNDYGYTSDPTQVAERVESLCTDQGYKNVEECFNYRFGLDLRVYSSTCGYDEPSTLFSRLFIPFSGTVDIQVQIDRPIVSGSPILSQFTFFPSLFDYEMGNNVLNYTLSALINSGSTGGSSGGGGSVGGGGGSVGGGSSPITFIPKITNTPVMGSTTQTGIKIDLPSTPIPITTIVQQKAYEWALSKGITTVATLQEARIDKNITRAELAKMLSVYATDILGKTAVQSDKKCIFTDNDQANKDLLPYITQVCELGIMGVQSDGKTPLKKFNPNAYVTRAEFGTVLSRVLYGTTNNTSSPQWREGHLNILKQNNIISVVNPNLQEQRGWIMTMLYRTVQ